MNSQNKTITLLFNPFVYIAGFKAMLLGLAAILATGAIGAVARTHFDGVLDTHTGAAAPVWLFLAEGLIDWLCLALVLLLAGRLISKTSFRSIDLLGTQALARWPTLLVVLMTTPPAFARFGQNLAQQLTGGQKIEISGADALLFMAVILLMIPLLCWLVYLMYKSFSVCCNVKGARAIITFIAGLLIAEVASKFAIIGLFKLA